MTPEGRIKANVNKALKGLEDAYPGKIWRFMPVQRGMGKQALDYILCVNGQFVSVETKRDEKHDLTPQQQNTKRDIQQSKGIVLVVNGDGTLAVMRQVLVELIEDPEKFHAWYRPSQSA